MPGHPELDNVTLNGKSARVYGAEWDITAIPITGLTLEWSGSYLDARYTNFTFIPPPGYLLPTGTTNLTGTPFPLPAWQTSVTATYAFGLHEIGDLAGWGLDAFRRIISGRAAIWRSLPNYNPSQQTAAYGMLNLQFDAGRHSAAPTPTCRCSSTMRPTRRPAGRNMWAC